MRAFQCSRCKHLSQNDTDDTVFCEFGITATPKYRDKDDRKICLESYEELDEIRIWHEPFYWEKKEL